jgi:periplasmic protein TonB
MRSANEMEDASKSDSSTVSLIIALLIFLLVAAGGVIGYLYFFAEPKRQEPENKTITDSPPSKPVDKDQEVPMPDAGSSQSSPPQKQEVPQPATESSEPQKEKVAEPASRDTEKSDQTVQDIESSGPIRITSDVVQPVLIHKVNPDYPEIARKARIQGVVILEAVITKDGTVENAKVLRRLHPILDQAAVNAVQQWRYKPAKLNGKPVKVYSTVTVKFTLK